nr:immunoglobulin heavy chain junction region [Mus musculus]MBK4184840.1 immunoglobulin heavy chain junction region [Mus musculus]MBK4184841.1 immunoglobulin heavy chain junction region [Mus musculus]
CARGDYDAWFAYW